MRFEQGNIILFLLAAAVLGVFFIFAARARRKAWEKFAQKELLIELAGKVDFRRRRFKAIALYLGILFCLFALMRPQWGFQWEKVKRQGLDIIVALDTSKSMLAGDIKPSRLERAKLALGDFARHLKGDRIGLVAFAGSAFLECPLTVDYEGFLLALQDVDTSTVPRGGTSISSAIREAIKSFPPGETKYKVLIVITDGEDHEGDALAAAKAAKDKGIAVFCIGIGTPQGELIFAPKDDGSKEFLKDAQGNAVKTRLNEDQLEKIALAADGAYLRAGAIHFGLDELYKGKISGMEKHELEGRMNKHYEERFQIFLLLGLIFILLEMITSDVKQ
jgi:Ca-activated chloride channel family protein